MFLSKFTDNLLEAINVSWKGLLALFIAMGIIYLSILILNAMGKKNHKE